MPAPAFSAYVKARSGSNKTFQPDSPGRAGHGVKTAFGTHADPVKAWPPQIVFAMPGQMVYSRRQVCFIRDRRFTRLHPFTEAFMQSQGTSYFQALYDVVRVINSSLNPQVVLQKVVEQVAGAMNSRACTLRLLDRTGKYLLASASFGLSKGYLRKGQVDLLKSRIDADVLSKGAAVYIRDVTNDERFQYPDAARAEGIASILVAPLLVDKKPIGVLRVYTERVRVFSRDERDFLMAVANVAAIAIENARLHEALRSDYELLTQYNYQIFED
jgi:transcriptional regulator with GAF, ATPase, and Fis domain